MLYGLFSTERAGRKGQVSSGNARWLGNDHARDLVLVVRKHPVSHPTERMRAESVLQVYRIPGDGGAHLRASYIYQITDLQVRVEAGAIINIITTEAGYGCGVHRDAEDGNADAGYYVVNGAL